jgi:hypothetical protein
MGLLFALVAGIALMILIARLASRTVRTDRPARPDQNGKEAVTLEKLAIYNVYELEGLVNLLVEKGVITKEELFERIEGLKRKEPGAG